MIVLPECLLILLLSLLSLQLLHLVFLTPWQDVSTIEQKWKWIRTGPTNDTLALTSR